MRRILLGVDGGNTKAAFSLFDTEGNCLAYLVRETCSHEALPGGYPGAERALSDGIERACHAAGITPGEIASAVFGLAGADTQAQHRELKAIADRLLPGRALVCNDALLGVKAAAPDGIGVCCINGTGCSIAGINDRGRQFQVGGIGYVSSDFAGGGFCAKEVLRRVYNARYRRGEPTRLTEGTLEILGGEKQENLLELFHPDQLLLKKYEYDLDRLLFRCAESGDPVAQQILRNVANTLARSTAGCIGELGFLTQVTVVMAGSMWVKSIWPAFPEEFRNTVSRLVPCQCRFLILQAPPVMGAVCWAYESLCGSPPEAEWKANISEVIRRAST